MRGLHLGPDTSRRSSGSAWLGVEPRHLATLFTVATERSFRTAAERLGYAPSSVSHHIAVLERAVGARLVERVPGKGRLNLTSAGALLVERSGDILGRLRAAEIDLVALAPHRRRQLLLGLHYGIAPSLLSQILARCAALRPEVEVISRDAPASPTLFEAIRDGVLDVALADPPTGAVGLAWCPVAVDSYRLLLPATWPVASAGGAVTAGQLMSLRLVGCTSAQPHALADRLGSSGTQVAQTESPALARALVAARVGAALLPRSLAEPAPPGTVALPLADCAFTRTIAVVWRRERQPTPGIDLICRVANELREAQSTALAAELATR
jgi:DNA-binding transcriptional LysR family regulator